MTKETLRAMARSLLLMLAATGAMPVLAASDAAQTAWPQAKPITWIVGFVPGGTADLLARKAAVALGRKTGRPVMVENHPGANGVIAMRAAAKATPDGYTIVTVAGPSLTGERGVPRLGKELAVVAMQAEMPMVLVGSMATDVARLPTLKALLDEARVRPTPWSYASSGIGGSQHLAGELLNYKAQTAIAHVPYKGGAQAAADVVSGQVPLAILGITPVLQHIRSGRLRAYAVTGDRRVAASLPDVPTMQEAGVADYSARQWYIVAAPAGVPEARVQKLHGWINEIMASPELAKLLEDIGANGSRETPEAVLSFAKAQDRKWKRFARAMY